MASVGTIKYKNGSTWVDILHPVGSFYLSTQSTSPSSLFGGTWVQITNAVLRGAAGTGYGGSDTHTLTINEMPKHTHTYMKMSVKASWSVTSGKGGLYNGTDGATSATGGAAFTELPRYYNLYVWYRSA